jgi:hypothetical protein
LPITASPLIARADLALAWTRSASACGEPMPAGQLRAALACRARRLQATGLLSIDPNESRP